MAEEISALFDPTLTLLVAGSDFYHGNSHELCRQQDATTLSSIENDSAEMFCALAT